MHMKIKLNKTDLKKVAGSFATGVTVITTRDKERGVVGMTASSFVSVSLDPPLISFYVDNNSKLIKQLTEGATIGVGILQKLYKSFQQEIIIWLCVVLKN
jgi:flavin reductase (DIM6/NTAB) family NADH-FMN oxidoreductase RutF